MKKNIIISLSFVWLGLLFPGISPGQQALITVIDRKNKEPVAFAHVCFEGIRSGTPRYSLTAIDGTVVNDVKEPTKVAISYMGYATYKDTIRPGQSLRIDLSPTVLNMDEVVVTAQYTPQRADKSIYPVEVINRVQIEQKAATNMADLLKDDASMRVSQDGVLGTSLTIQGLSGENVKFLMDGVPLVGRMNGNFDLNQISLYNVDHVEVIEGPMSVIYGSNALAGVVNIVTKENQSSLFSATVNGYTESVGVFNFDGGVTVNHNNHGFSIDGGRYFFGGYSDPDTSRDQTFKPRRQYFADAYYLYGNSVFKIKATGQYFNELLEDKGALQPPYFETAFDSYFTTVRYTGRLESTINLPRHNYITLLGAYSGYDRIKKTYFKNLTTLSEVVSGNPEDQDTTGIYSVMARGTFAKNNPDRKFNYQTGFDINWEMGTGKRIMDNRQEIGDYAAFLSLRWDPVAPLSFQPGVRFIYNTKYAAPVVYALSAKWNIIHGLSLRMNYSKGFRAPDVKELYLYFVDINHNIKGNPDLKAENSDNINLNFGWSSEKNKLAWGIELSGFYNVINNIITLAQSTGDLYTYINVDKYKTLGGQLNGSFNLYPALKISAGVAETGRYNSLAADNGGKSTYYFTTDFSSDISYRFQKPELTFALIYRYTGRTPQFYLVGNEVVEGYISAYNNMDFTVIKGFWQNRIRLSGGVKNIFNNKTIPAVGGTGGVHGSGNGDLAIGWGRTLFLKLAFTFNKYK